MTRTSPDCTDCRVGSVPEHDEYDRPLQGYLSPAELRNIAEARVRAEIDSQNLAREVARARQRLMAPLWKRILRTIFPFTITRRTP